MIQPNPNKYNLPKKATKINVALEDVLYTRFQSPIVLYFQNNSEIFEKKSKPSFTILTERLMILSIDFFFKVKVD